MSAVIEFISSDKGNDDYSTSSSESPGEGMPRSNPLIRQSKTTGQSLPRLLLDTESIKGKVIMLTHSLLKE